MKSILITGGAGYIGSHIAYTLEQQGYHLIILDTFVHQQAFNQIKTTIIKADFANQKILEKIFKTYNVEAVIHCAACIEVGVSIKDPAVFYETNVAKTITLLQTMLIHNIKKIIFSSSCAVYGDPAWLPLTEDHPKNPLSPYGRTKLMVEMILQDFSNAYDMHYVILRYFNAAGALPELNLGEQHQPETHIIPLLLRAALENNTFLIFGNDYKTNDGTAIRDYLHVVDIAIAHSKSLEYLMNNGKSDSFNLGTENGVSIAQMIKIVEEVTRKKIKVQVALRRLGDPAILIADATKARNKLQWQATYDVKTIIQHAFDFELSYNKKVYNEISTKKEGDFR